MVLSALISVYAKEKPAYLAQALGSLKDQTRMADEVVLVEDGPIDQGLKDVIDSFRECINIKSVKLPENKGLATALNAGLKQCVGDLVVRMDSDDFSLPNRLETQLNFMETHLDVAICSSYIEERNEDMSRSLGVRVVPEFHDEIVRFAQIRSPISHPAVIFRKDAVLGVGGYPDIYPEDYPLWCLLIKKGFRFANIPTVLVLMRTGEGFITRRGAKFFWGTVKVIWFQKKIGFISWWGFVNKVIYRMVVHLPPTPIRRVLYRASRKTYPK